MISPIEAQFLRLKHEAEERKIKFLESLIIKLADLIKVKDEVNNFDFKN